MAGVNVNTCDKHMFSTPDISHIRQSDYDNIYEPVEDTFLMLDALENEYKYLIDKKFYLILNKVIFHALTEITVAEIDDREERIAGASAVSYRPTCCVEVGCGSGVCITFLAKMLGPAAAAYWCTDINPLAADMARRTAEQNKVGVEPVVTNLLQGLHSRLRGRVDVLIFNPPYVVTPAEEVGSSGIEASWAGGKDGRQVLNRLLPCVPDILSPEGVFYLVVIKENKPDDIQRILGKDGFNMEQIISRRSGPELLSVLKFTRSLEF